MAIQRLVAVDPYRGRAATKRHPQTRGGGCAMSLENIYYIGQTVAVIAILASLVAIWLQMRQSQKMERAAAQRDLLKSVADWSEKLLDASEAGDDFVRGLVSYKDADSKTQSAIQTFVGNFVFITESALNMHKDGFFSEGTWQGIEGAALALLRTPGGREYWNHAQHFIGPEIVGHLNKRLAEMDPDLPDFIDLIPSMKTRLAELDAAAASEAAS